MNTAIWVLVVVTGMNGGRFTLNFQEFTSRVKCEVQAQNIKATSDSSKMSYTTIKAWCAEK